MFDLFKPHSAGWYNMRNPMVAEIYHPIVTSILRTIAPNAAHKKSEDFFLDEDTRKWLNMLYMESLEARKNIGIDAHMANAIEREYQLIESMVPHENKAKGHIVEIAVFAAFERIRYIAFGIAPGLATNKDHARAITADILYELTCRYAHSEPGGMRYQFGSTCRSFGRRIDRLGWTKMPHALMIERQQGWITGYHVPETEQRAFAA